jgi:peptidoglycan hydrolase CwlO-like protein
MERLMAQIKASHAETMAEMKTLRKEMQAHREATENYREKMEPNAEKMKFVAEQPEAAVEAIGALEDRYESWHLAVGRRSQPKKRTYI